MPITTVTSLEFNQDVSKIKRAAINGPVFITHRGHPAYVLLSIKDYQKLTVSNESIIDLLAMPEAADILNSLVFSIKTYNPIKNFFC